MATSGESWIMAMETGCRLWTDCLTCPLPECVLDMHWTSVQGLGLRLQTERLGRELERLMDEGLDIQQAADRQGVHCRTAYRRLDAWQSSELREYHAALERAE